MRKHLHTGKIFLNISAKYRVYYIKMARIFLLQEVAAKSYIGNETSKWFILLWVRNSEFLLFGTLAVAKCVVNREQLGPEYEPGTCCSRIKCSGPCAKLKKHVQTSLHRRSTLSLCLLYLHVHATAHAYLMWYHLDIPEEDPWEAPGGVRLG
jgi:hypothetical protein